jgi:hypothetical protein
VVKATKVTAAVEKEKSGHHCNRNSTDAFQTILNQVNNKVNVFNFTPGREYAAFPKLKRKIFEGLSVKHLHEWIRKYKNLWHRQNRHMYDKFKY